MLSQQDLEGFCNNFGEKTTQSLELYFRKVNENIDFFRWNFSIFWNFGNFQFFRWLFFWIDRKNNFWKSKKKSGHQYRSKNSLRIEWEHSQPLQTTPDVFSRPCFVVFLWFWLPEANFRIWQVSNNPGPHCRDSLRVSIVNSDNLTIIVLICTHLLHSHYIVWGPSF